MHVSLQVQRGRQLENERKNRRHIDAHVSADTMGGGFVLFIDLRQNPLVTFLDCKRTELDTCLSNCRQVRR
ncbi:MAG: hypothetical protein ABW206_14140 [Agrobacterium vaccinii]